MSKMKYLAGILVFGSLWGFSEVIIGSALSDAGLPSGAIMTGLFALTFLFMSRMLFRKPGMQLGMGLVAGGLRMFNPFVGCHLCSAIAIMAEGAIFEIIFYKISSDLKDLKTPLLQGSISLLSAYFMFIGAYVVTQILTPIVAGASFYVENLIVIMPKILASGLLPAIIGSIMVPIIILVKKTNVKMKDILYYPTTLGISALCWLIVVGNWLLVGA
jgi:hypothetical protein